MSPRSGACFPLKWETAGVNSPAVFGFRTFYVAL